MFSYDFTPKDNNIFEDNKQPKLLRLCHNFNNPGWVYNYHLHKNATEIVYIANGKAEYTIDMIHIGKRSNSYYGKRRSSFHNF